jgi:hypothetical protein
MVISDIRLAYKAGGRGGVYTRQEGRKAGRQEFKGGRAKDKGTKDGRFGR